MDPAERMRALLRYANSAEVARGLTAAGYPVSGPTVSRWAKGNNVTPLAVQLVADLLELTGQEKTAPPDWAERLLRGIFALEAKGGVTDTELAQAQARVAIYLAAGTQKPPRPKGGGAGGASSS